VACGNAVENLIQSSLFRVGNQPASKVFLQRLMRACGSLTQDLVRFLRNIFDLHTRHSASLAPSALKRKRTRISVPCPWSNTSGSGVVVVQGQLTRHRRRLAECLPGTLGFAGHAEISIAFERIEELGQALPEKLQRETLPWE
jgi:hypothetical protein